MANNQNPFKSLLTSNNETPIMLALEQTTRTFNCLPVEDIKNFWNPDLCRVDLLPLLAEQLGVVYWDDTWGEAQKRKVCKNAVIVSKHKGTVYALKKALEALNLSTEVIEWWQKEPIGKPISVEVILHEQDILYSQDQYNIIYKLIDDVKRLAALVVLSKKASISTNYYVGGSYNQVTKWRISNG